MECARAATFGRFQPQVALPAERSQQIGRLFQAKQRANTGSPDDQTAVQPQSIQRQDAVEKQPQPIRQAPGSTSRPSVPPPTTGGSALASRLLEKKRKTAEQRKDDS
jgi:hypothetical protein